MNNDLQLYWSKISLENCCLICWWFWFRFKDWISEESEYGYGRPSLNAVLQNVRRGFEKGSDKIKTFKKPLTFVAHKKPCNTQKKTSIINPQGIFLQNWNKIFLFASVIALAIDPLFFYIPVVDGEKHCLNLHTNLEIAASLLRTFIDAFYVIHIVFQFRTAYISPSSRVFGRGELVEDPKAIALKYLSSYFIIDLLSILPLPQVYTLTSWSVNLPMVSWWCSFVSSAACGLSCDPSRSLCSLRTTWLLSYSLNTFPGFFVSIRFTVKWREHQA